MRIWAAILIRDYTGGGTEGGEVEEVIPDTPFIGFELVADTTFEAIKGVKFDPGAAG